MTKAALGLRRAAARAGPAAGKVEPDDIVQEVSVEAVRSLSQTDLADREIFSWLCHLTEQRIVDAHRRFFAAQKRDAGREVPLGSPAATPSTPPWSTCWSPR